MVKRSQLKAILPWMREQTFLWSTGFIFLGLLWFALATNTFESRIRLSGLGLQHILGLATVVEGIRRIRRDFELPPMLSDLTQYLSRFPPLGRPVVGILKQPRGVMRFDASGKLPTPLPAHTKPDAPLDERIAALEANIGDIHERLQQTHNDIDTSFCDSIISGTEKRDKDATEFCDINWNLQQRILRWLARVASFRCHPRYSCSRNCLLSRSGNEPRIAVVNVRNAIRRVVPND